MIQNKDLNVFYDNFQAILESVKSMSKKNFRLIDKIKRTLFIVWNYPAKRIIHKCGLSVAFLAPDGTGKSTVIQGINDTCSGSFYGVKNYYFRPHLFKNLGHYNKLNPSEEASSNNDPHNVVLDGKIKSIIRFLFYNIDFLIGGIIKVDIDKMKKKLVVFDRYYYDYYADMKRYKYSIGTKWAHFFCFLIPKPDLIIVLDAPAEIILDRKKELTFSEIESQRTQFRKLKEKYSIVEIVDTCSDKQDVISKVTEIILRKQAEKTAAIIKR